MAPPFSYVCGDLTHAVSYGSYMQAGKGVGLTLVVTSEATDCQLRVDVGLRSASMLIFDQFWLVGEDVVVDDR